MPEGLIDYHPVMIMSLLSQAGRGGRLAALVDPAPPTRRAAAEGIVGAE